MAIMRADFPLPDVDDPLTGEFFAGAERGELVIPRCESCHRFVWYPAAECGVCGSTDAPRWTAVSGDGCLFSWAVLRRAFLPAFEAAVPFVTALVALAEDPAVRLCTYIVDTDPSMLEADAPVRAVFRPLTFPTVPDKSVTVPMFALASRA